MNDARAAHTSSHGTGFWVAAAIGAAAMGVGVWTALTRAGAVHPVEFAAYVLGAVLVHDLIVAPATLLVGTLVVRRAPRTARGIAAGAIAATAVLTAFALPVVFRWGAQSDNPSMLPRNGAAGLVLTLAVVWAVAGLVLFRRTGRR
jgi:hypothetical protein